MPSLPFLLSLVLLETLEMYKQRENGFKSHSTQRTFVLDGCAPDDVARAMIQDGRQKEPFCVFDVDEAFRRIQHFKDMMPRVQILYAMKANDCDIMLKLAVSQGLGFDCASPGEINKLRQLNVNPQSIIYANPTKTPEHIMFARQSGVQHTTFDTSYELTKIKKNWPDASLLIRIRVDSDSIYKLGERFGCDFNTEAVDLLDEAAALALDVVGVAFHVGSACFTPESYRVALKHARALFDHEERVGRSMKIVDIGGGFLSERTDTIDEVSDLINSILEELFPDPRVQVVAEPGRYLCDSSTNLYCNINNVRRLAKNNKPLNMIYINDGIFGTLRCSEPWHTVHKFKWTGMKAEEDLEDAILFGPSCHAHDRIMKDHSVRLPRCAPLDWLVFPLQGAYNLGFSSRFCCLEIPLLRSVISKDLWSKVKDIPVFGSSEFMLNPELSTPLPSTLPQVLPTLSNDIYPKIAESFTLAAREVIPTP